MQQDAVVIISFAAWQAERLPHFMIFPLAVGGVCALLAIAEDDTARRVAYLIDTARTVVGFTLSHLFGNPWLNARNVRWWRESQIRLVKDLFGVFIVAAEVLYCTSLPVGDDNHLRTLHQFVKLVVQSIVSSVWLTWGSLAHVVVNGFVAKSMLYRFHGRVELWLYAHAVFLLLGYVMVRLQRSLYAKENALAATQREQARLLEALRESNERREYEILMKNKMCARARDPQTRASWCPRPGGLAERARGRCARVPFRRLRKGTLAKSLSPELTCQQTHGSASHHTAKVSDAEASFVPEGEAAASRAADGTIAKGDPARAPNVRNRPGTRQEE